MANRFRGTPAAILEKQNEAYIPRLPVGQTAPLIWGGPCLRTVPQLAQFGTAPWLLSIFVQGRSIPPAPGRQRCKRRRVSPTPRINPLPRKASSAYREQLGSNPHRCPRTGETCVRYRRKPRTASRSQTGRDGRGRRSTSQSTLGCHASARSTEGINTSGTFNSMVQSGPVNLARFRLQVSMRCICYTTLIRNNDSVASVLADDQ